MNRKDRKTNGKKDKRKKTRREGCKDSVGMKERRNSKETEDTKKKKGRTERRKETRTTFNNGYKVWNTSNERTKI